METKEKMERYISNSKVPYKTAYDLTLPEARELLLLAEKSRSELFNALVLAFCYGQAKGYRMATKK